jgi:hypothetical protein
MIHGGNTGIIYQSIQPTTGFSDPGKHFPHLGLMGNVKAVMMVIGYGKIHLTPTAAENLIAFISIIFYQVSADPLAGTGY